MGRCGGSSARTSKTVRAAAAHLKTGSSTLYLRGCTVALQLPRTGQIQRLQVGRKRTASTGLHFLAAHTTHFIHLGVTRAKEEFV